MLWRARTVPSVRAVQAPQLELLLGQLFLAVSLALQCGQVGRVMFPGLFSGAMLASMQLVAGAEDGLDQFAALAVALLAFLRSGACRIARSLAAAQALRRSS